MTNDDVNKHLKGKARFVRNKVLDMTVSSKKGHIGEAFSCTDILVSIYYSGIFRFDSNDPKW
jgi:transketolase